LAPCPRLLAGFTVADPRAMLLGRETIYRDGERVGWLTSGGYGYTIRQAIGYGYVRRGSGVDRAFVLAGSYELEIAGERFPAEVSLAPFYDPKGERIRG
jgi:4-methylaminobutanoate oxidase (formaldehyde-forming)